MVISVISVKWDLVLCNISLACRSPTTHLSLPAMLNLKTSPSGKVNLKYTVTIVYIYISGCIYNCTILKLC